MTKIANVRLPSAASSQYSPEQFNQLVRSLEQVILQLNSNYTSTIDQDSAALQSFFANAAGAGGFAGGIRGFQLSDGISLPYGMFMNTADQTNAGATSANALTFNQINFSNGIEVVDNSKIYVPCAGQYLVTMSLQVTNAENSVQQFELWAVNSGTNYPLSRRRYDVPERKNESTPGHLTAVLSGIFTVNQPAIEYLEMNWWGETTNVYLEAFDAGATPTRPAIPSAILTINFVSAE
jgi:hypothetical protein